MVPLILPLLIEYNKEHLMKYRVSHFNPEGIALKALLFMAAISILQYETKESRCVMMNTEVSSEKLRDIFSAIDLNVYYRSTQKFYY
jgi:hypothetical protein